MKDMRGQVGPYKPHGDIFHKTYIGDDPTLEGKTALVGFTFVGGATVAQFNDLDCGYAYGWHQFKHSDFWPVRDRRYHVATAHALYGTPLDVIATFDDRDECLAFVNGWSGDGSLVWRDTHET